MFNPSWNAPSLVAPSPKKHAATCLVFFNLKARPIPVTILIPPATIAIAGTIPTSGSPKCIEPPLPLQQPVSLP